MECITCIKKIFCLGQVIFSFFYLKQIVDLEVIQQTNVLYRFHCLDTTSIYSINCRLGLIIRACFSSALLTNACEPNKVSSILYVQAFCG